MSNNIIGHSLRSNHLNLDKAHLFKDTSGKVLSKSKQKPSAFESFKRFITFQSDSDLQATNKVLFDLFQNQEALRQEVADYTSDEAIAFKKNIQNLNEKYEHGNTKNVFTKSLLAVINFVRTHIFKTNPISESPYHIINLKNLNALEVKEAPVVGKADGIKFKVVPFIPPHKAGDAKNPDTLITNESTPSLPVSKPLPKLTDGDNTVSGPLGLVQTPQVKIISGDLAALDGRLVEVSTPSGVVKLHLSADVVQMLESGFIPQTSGLSLVLNERFHLGLKPHGNVGVELPQSFQLETLDPRILVQMLLALGIGNMVVKSGDSHALVPFALLQSGIDTLEIEGVPGNALIALQGVVGIEDLSSLFRAITFALLSATDDEAPETNLFEEFKNSLLKSPWKFRVGDNRVKLQYFPKRDWIAVTLLSQSSVWIQSYDSKGKMVINRSLNKGAVQQGSDSLVLKAGLRHYIIDPTNRNNFYELDLLDESNVKIQEI